MHYLTEDLLAIEAVTRIREYLNSNLEYRDYHFDIYDKSDWFRVYIYDRFKFLEHINPILDILDECDLGFNLKTYSRYNVFTSLTTIGNSRDDLLDIPTTKDPIFDYEWFKLINLDRIIVSSYGKSLYGVELTVNYKKDCHLIEEKLAELCPMNSLFWSKDDYGWRCRVNYLDVPSLSNTLKDLNVKKPKVVKKVSGIVDLIRNYQPKKQEVKIYQQILEKLDEIT